MHEPSEQQFKLPKLTLNINDIDDMNFKAMQKMTFEGNVPSRIDEACHNLEEMLKSYIHPEDR